MSSLLDSCSRSGQITRAESIFSLFNERGILFIMILLFIMYFYNFNNIFSLLLLLLLLLLFL